MPNRFRQDERAIEGLPIRLVIALVVGVASLSVMMGILGDIDQLGVTELDVQPDPTVVRAGDHDVNVTVVDPDGTPIEGATVIAKGGTARLSQVVTETTGGDGTATISLTARLGPNQAEGTVVFDVQPPASGQYADRRANSEVLVVEG